MSDSTPLSYADWQPLQIAVYRSSRHELMYLYLPALKLNSEQEQEAQADHADLSVLPEVLLQRFGTPQFSFSFELTPKRVLATTDAVTVHSAIVDQGFYLQMPPRVVAAETPDARNPHEGRS